MQIVAFSLLCGLGAVVLQAALTEPAPLPVAMAGTAAGFALALAVFGAGRVPDPAWAGAATAALAGLCLARGRRSWLAWIAPAGSGLLAGIWAILLAGLGMPWPLALPIAAAAPLAAALLAARRARFAPLVLREEGLLLLLALGLAVAMLPSVLSGWQSAKVLNAGREAGAQTLSAGTVATVAAALAAGAGWAVWTRHWRGRQRS